MKKWPVSFSLLLVIAFSSLLVFASPSWAKKKTKSKAKSAQKLLYLDASLSFTYDDNIIRYSDADLDLFAGDLQPSKFAIESKQDWIIKPRIRPRIKGNLIGHHVAWLTLGYDYFGYVRNDVRRYSRFSMDARQYFSSKGYAEISYSYIPDYYYRNLYIGSDSTYTDPYHSANFSKSAFGAEVGHDLSRSLKMDIGYHYQHKSFNEAFSFRNLNLHGFDVNAIWQVLRRLKLWSFFNYEFARTEAWDLPDTSVVPDYSYNAFDITLGLRHYSALWPKVKPEVVAAFKFRRIDYQTNKLPDVLQNNVYQFGRGDNNYEVRLGTAWSMPYQMRLAVDYYFLIKRASLPNIYPYRFLNITETTSQLERKLNYSANVISIGVSRDF